MVYIYIYISHPLSILLSTFIIQQVIRFTKIHFVFNLTCMMRFANVILTQGLAWIALDNIERAI